MSREWAAVISTSLALVLVAGSQLLLAGTAANGGEDLAPALAATRATRPASASRVGVLPRDLRLTGVARVVSTRPGQAVEARGTTYAVSGVVKGATGPCADCCQELVVFRDGFESSTTSAWSAAVP